VVAEERVGLEQIESGVAVLAVDYLRVPPAPMLAKAVDLRADVLHRLQRRHHRPQERADLYLAAGRVSGVLAYAALDLGEPDAAFHHTQAGWTCAEYAGDDELRTWIRGTQSLIARFQGAYERALQLVRDGRRYAGNGTSAVRLLCGEAQCLANLGDSVGANRALKLARDARERVNTPDSVSGLLTFPEAKQHYYEGSSLIWLDGGPDARRAVAEATRAIEMWRHDAPEDRSLDDEALAHVYVSTALLKLRELDGAIDALRPILDLPPERRISWIGKGLGRVAAMLREQPYQASPLAEEAYDEIRAYSA